MSYKKSVEATISDIDTETQNSRNDKKDLADIRKDLIVLSVGFSLLYGGLVVSQDVQRALNPAQELQLTVRGLFILSRLFSCALLPTMSIDRLGTKGALLVAYGIHLVYLLASLDPRFSTLIPCSIAAGITSPLLWISAEIYVTSLAVGHCKTSTKLKLSSTEATIARFFGVFFSFVFVGCLFPPVISSIVMAPALKGRVASSQIKFCGSSYCNEHLEAQELCLSNNKSNGNINWCPALLYQKPNSNPVFAFGGIYVVMATLGFLLILCLVRNLLTGQARQPKPETDFPLTLTRSVINSLGATFEILRRNPIMFMLAFTAFTCGIIEYFFAYDFSKAFILCISGYHLQGFLLFTSAALASLTALILVFIFLPFCRIWMTILSTLFAYLCLLPLFVWSPDDNDKGIAFIFTAMWGIVTTLWNVHLTGLHGHLGRSDLSASFSNLLFWWTLGQLLGFVWAELVCVQHKLFILAPLLAASVLSVVAVEVCLRPPFFLSSVAPAPAPASVQSNKVRSTPDGSSLVESSDARPHQQTNALAMSENGLEVATVSSLSGKLRRESVPESIASSERVLAPSAPPVEIIDDDAADVESVIEPLAKEKEKEN